MQDLNGNKKKTRAQKAMEEHEARLQRIVDEQTEACKRFKAEYPQRLLRLIVDALREDSNYVTVEQKIDVVKFNYYYAWLTPSRVSVPLTLTDYHDVNQIISYFNDVEQDIENKKLDRIEAENTLAKKQAALSKLTEEERKLLGL